MPITQQGARLPVPHAGQAVVQVAGPHAVVRIQDAARPAPLPAALGCGCRLRAAPRRGSWAPPRHARPKASPHPDRMTVHSTATARAGSAAEPWRPMYNRPQ